MRRVTAMILLLILALGMTACGNAEKTETIYVHTRSLRTIGENEIRMEYTYSPKGTPTSVKTYFNDTLYQTASTRTSGGISYQTIVDYEGNATTQATTVTRDDKGNVTMVEISIGSTPVSRTRYTYDDQNRTTNSNTVTGQGITDISYSYDAAGNVTEQIVDDETDNTYTRTVYTYDDRGYVTEEQVYDKAGALQGSIRYTYSQDNKTRVASTYDAKGDATGEKVEAQYDEHGNLIKEITYQGDEVLQTVVNTYEAMEVPVEE